MKISEIENMDAIALKACRQAAADAEEIKTDPTLAARYVQARLDATVRDEKLAEQGRTITALQNALDAANQKQEATDDQIEELGGALERSSTALTASQAEEERQRTLSDQLTAERDQARDELSRTKTNVEQLTSQRDEARTQVSDLSSSLEQVTNERNDALKLATRRRAVLANLSSIIAPLLIEE